MTKSIQTATAALALVAALTGTAAAESRRVINPETRRTMENYAKARAEHAAERNLRLAAIVQLDLHEGMCPGSYTDDFVKTRKQLLDSYISHSTVTVTPGGTTHTTMKASPPSSSTGATPPGGLSTVQR